MDFLKICKITIHSLLILICAILGLSFFIVSFPEWKTYGLSFLLYDHTIENIIPIQTQALRAGSLICLLVFLFSTFSTIFYIKNLEQSDVKKNLLFSCGFLIWIFIPYLFFLIRKNKYHKSFFEYLNIDIKKQENNLFFKKNNNNNKIYAIFTCFVFLVSLTSFIFILLPIFNFPESRFEINDPRSNYLFDSVSFFTAQINILSFLFLLFFIPLNKKNIFRNNNILLSISSYITFVMIIFWIILFPSIAKSGIFNRYPNPFFLTVTIWLHLINPLCFILFSAYTFFKSENKTTNFWKLSQKYAIYPFFYSLYAFSTCFFTQFSPYGSLTNINPNSILWYSSSEIIGDGMNTIQKNGNPLMVLTIIPLAISLLLILFIFWLINSKISKSDIKKLLNVKY